MFPVLILAFRAAFMAIGIGLNMAQTFATTSLPELKDSNTIVIRVDAGWSAHKNPKNPKNPKYELGGFFPDIILWDEDGELIGIGHGRKRKIADGDGQDIWIVPSTRNPGSLHRAEYLSVNANRNDNICISAITLKQPNGPELTITGDIPAGLCGYHGYSESMKKIETEDGPYSPICFWMTGNEDTNDIFPRSIVFHLADFVGYGNHTIPANSDNDGICAVQPRMWKYDHWPKSFPIFDPPLVYPLISDESRPSGLRDDREWNYLDVNYLQDRNDWRNKSDSSPWKRRHDGPRRSSVDLSIQPST